MRCFGARHPVNRSPKQGSFGSQIQPIFWHPTNSCPRIYAPNRQSKSAWGRVPINDYITEEGVGLNWAVGNPSDTDPNTITSHQITSHHISCAPREILSTMSRVHLQSLTTIKYLRLISFFNQTASYGNVTRIAYVLVSTVQLLLRPCVSLLLPQNFTFGRSGAKKLRLGPGGDLPQFYKIVDMSFSAFLPFQRYPPSLSLRVY